MGKEHVKRLKTTQEKKPIMEEETKRQLEIAARISLAERKLERANKGSFAERFWKDVIKRAKEGNIQ